LLTWVGEKREVRVFLLCERGVLLEGIGADPEIRDIEGFD
jgi:hypothetical protein